MTDTNVFQLSQPGDFADPLTEVLRKGARALLAQAVEAEVATLLSRYADETTVIQEKPPSRTQEKTQTRLGPMFCWPHLATRRSPPRSPSPASESFARTRYLSPKTRLPKTSVLS